MKIFKSKSYWYGVYKTALYPVVKEKVESTDKKWDDSVLEAFDKIAEVLFGPDKEE